LYKRESSDPL